MLPDRPLVLALALIISQESAGIGSVVTRQDQLEALHVSRSRLIDGFSSVEKGVFAILTRIGHNCSNELFGKKLKALREAKPSPKLSTATKSKLISLLTEFAPHYEVRGDVAHSSMHIAEVDGELCACFVNPKNADNFSTTARVITLAQLERLNADVAKIGRDLAKLTPPSSPPPPSQGAAGGP